MPDPTDPKRRPGRPPLSEEEQPARVHVSLSPKAYDQALTIARRDGLSMPEMIRRSLARTIQDEAEDE